MGYGLEEYVTDGFSGETIREYMLPQFRAGDYSEGLLNGTTRVIGRIAQARGVTIPDVARPQTRSSSGRHLPPIGLILFVILLVASLLRRRGGPGNRFRPRMGPWSGWSGGVGPFGGGFGGFGGGGGGGGFGGFGGGRSGGGGASGGW